MTEMVEQLQALGPLQLEVPNEEFSEVGELAEVTA
jgi:hypothetical protein